MATIDPMIHTPPDEYRTCLSVRSSGYSPPSPPTGDRAAADAIHLGRRPPTDEPDHSAPQFRATAGQPQLFVHHHLTPTTPRGYWRSPVGWSPSAATRTATLPATRPPLRQPRRTGPRRRRRPVVLILDAQHFIPKTAPQPTATTPCGLRPGGEQYSVVTGDR